MSNRGSASDGGRRAEFRKTVAKAAASGRERARVACTRNCNGYAMSGVDGAKVLRGCTLRRSCASVSRLRAERAVPSAGCDGRPRQKRNSISSSAPVPCQVLTGKFFLLFPRNSFSLICCATRLSPGLRRRVREIFINQQEITTLSWGVWLRRR